MSRTANHNPGHGKPRHTTISTPTYTSRHASQSKSSHQMEKSRGQNNANHKVLGTKILKGSQPPNLPPRSGKKAPRHSEDDVRTGLTSSREKKAAHITHDERKHIESHEMTKPTRISSNDPTPQKQQTSGRINSNPTGWGVSKFTEASMPIDPTPPPQPLYTEHSDFYPTPEEPKKKKKGSKIKKIFGLWRRSTI